MLQKLFDNVQDFFQRFGVKQTPQSAARQVEEELHEVLTAYKDDQAHELADLLYTVVALAYSLGIRYQDIEDAILVVLEKNNQKSEETHYVAPDGKVRRRQ